MKFFKNLLHFESESEVDSVQMRIIFILQLDF